MRETACMHWKRFNVHIRVILVFILALSLVGCSGRNSASTSPTIEAGSSQQSADASTSPDPTDSPASTDTESATQTTPPSDTPTDSPTEAPLQLPVNPSAFHVLEESAILEAMVRSDSSDGSDAFDMNGFYDMDGDGVLEEIRMSFGSIMADSTSTITVNDQTLSGDFIMPLDAFLVDLNIEDSQTELVVFDAGPSEDPEYTFYRYKKGVLENIGTIYGLLRSDGNGSILSHWSTGSFDPNMVFGWFVLSGNAFVQKHVDKSVYIGHTFRFPTDMDGFFVAMDQAPDDYTLDYEGYQTFQAGTAFTLLDVYLYDDAPYWYFVSMEDGTTGILYFYMGD